MIGKLKNVLLFHFFVALIVTGLLFAGIQSVLNSLVEKLNINILGEKLGN